MEELRGTRFLYVAQNTLTKWALRLTFSLQGISVDFSLFVFVWIFCLVLPLSRFGIRQCGCKWASRVRFPW